MLNPFAHEYTPASVFPPELPPTTLKKNAPFKKKEQPKKKKSTPDVKAETSKPSSTKKTESKPNATRKGSKDMSKPTTHTKTRRKSSHHNTQVSTAVPLDPFEKESKFITIEAAVDPIRRIDIAKNNASNKQATNAHSTATDKHLFEHGYERYIDWVGCGLT
jgi:hypothetical protein